MIQAISLPSPIGLGCLDQILQGSVSPLDLHILKSPVVIGLSSTKLWLFTNMNTNPFCDFSLCSASLKFACKYDEFVDPVHIHNQNIKISKTELINS